MATQVSVSMKRDLPGAGFTHCPIPQPKRRRALLSRASALRPIRHG